MSSTRKNISEYLVILEKYIGTSKSNEIIDRIGSGFFKKGSPKPTLDKFYPESFRLRSFIDRVITYTESI